MLTQVHAEETKDVKNVIYMHTQMHAHTQTYTNIHICICWVLGNLFMCPRIIEVSDTPAHQHSLWYGQ